ncbi:MAG: pyruvate kinase [Candidatus Krumholzibacteriia bacterium]|nr:pyruvate kinase [Candidatus Latescibacterota bacterium]
MRKTKIVATIGPASSSPETLDALLEAGMNVARLNFSHGTHDEHRAKVEALRAASARTGKPVAILQDLAGPKIRVGNVAGGSVRLKPGARFLLRAAEDAPGDADGVSVNTPRVVKDVAPGEHLLLADGALELEVLEQRDDALVTRVLVGGVLGSHKGINLPSSTLKLPSLTAKDEDDLAFGLSLGVDFVALSFVREAADLERCRELMRAHGDPVPLIAKVEKHEALTHMDAIIAAADGVMVARGDLGVETPLARVPTVQKQLIAKCNRAGIPVITATQMLGSMTQSPRPTRAEVADVANAILDGTDAVMLSEESAMGQYPVEAVATMDRIARETEEVFPYDSWEGRVAHSARQGLREAVAHGACALAAAVDAAAIIPFTRSGGTAQLVAKYRPAMPILAPCSLERTRRRLLLSWGIIPLASERLPDSEAMLRHACQVALDTGLVAPGQTVVLTAGLPVGHEGVTNTIRAAVLD